jgi:hypothetical protein
LEAVKVAFLGDEERQKLAEALKSDLKKYMKP